MQILPVLGAVSVLAFRRQSGRLSGFKFSGSWNKSPKESAKGKRSRRVSDNSSRDIFKDTYLVSYGDKETCGRYGKIHGPAIQAVWHLVFKPWYLMTSLALIILRIITEIRGTILSKPVMLITKILTWFLGVVVGVSEGKGTRVPYLNGNFLYEGPGKDMLLDFLGLKENIKNSGTGWNPGGQFAKPCRSAMKNLPFLS
jgi:hypothetical protein